MAMLTNIPVPGLNQAPVQTGPVQGPFVLRTDARSTLGYREVEIIRKRIQRAMRAKKDWGLPALWTQLLAYYEGRYFAGLPHAHQVAANWVFSIHRQLVASLYYQNPTFYMRGLSDRGRATAPVMEPVFALELEVMGASKAINDWLSDALLLGCGFLKHGYNAEVSLDPPYRESRPDLTDDVFGDGYEELRERAPLTESHPRVHYGHPWTKRIRPWHVFIDPDAKEWDEWRWICHRYSRPFIDIVEDARLNVAARERLTPTGKTGWFDDSDVQMLDDMTRKSISDDASAVVCYEYYDRSTNRVITLADTGDEPLLDKTHDYFGKFTAWERLSFFEANDHPYGLSIVEQFRPQAEALNVLRTQMMEHFDTYGQTRVAYIKQYLTADVVKKILAGKAPRAIPVEGVDAIDKALKFLDRMEINPDAWKLANLFHQDMVEVSGSYELSQRSTETATESLKLDEKSGLRIDKMRDTFDSALQASARRLLKLLKTFWGPMRYVPIVDDDGEILQMAPLYGTDVSADYDVFIQPGSTARVDQAVRARQVIDSIPHLQTLDTLIQRQGKAIDFVELTKEFLRTVSLSRSPERLIKPFGDVVPTMGAPAQEQAPAASGVGPWGPMPTETGAGIEGRLASEIFGGGAFGGSLV